MEISDHWESPDISVGNWLYGGTKPYRRRGELKWFTEFIRIVEHIKGKGKMRLGLSIFSVCPDEYFHTETSLSVDVFRAKPINDNDLRTEVRKIFGEAE